MPGKAFGRILILWGFFYLRSWYCCLIFFNRETIIRSFQLSGIDTAFTQSLNVLHSHSIIMVKKMSAYIKCRIVLRTNFFLCPWIKSFYRESNVVYVICLYCDILKCLTPSLPKQEGSIQDSYYWLAELYSVQIKLNLIVIFSCKWMRIIKTIGQIRATLQPLSVYFSLHSVQVSQDHSWQTVDASGLRSLLP